MKGIIHVSSSTICYFALGLLLLASFSRPLFTSVHNRFAKPHSRVGLINGNEKSAKAHQLNTDYGKLPIYFEPNLRQQIHK